jgi:hypothetical protein
MSTRVELMEANQRWAASAIDIGGMIANLQHDLDREREWAKTMKAHYEAKLERKRDKIHQLGVALKTAGACMVQQMQLGGGKVTEAELKAILFPKAPYECTTCGSGMATKDGFKWLDDRCTYECLSCFEAGWDE